MSQDPLSAVITYLKTVTAVTNKTSTRIFGQELPGSQVASMPQQAAVLATTGGLGTVGFTNYRGVRLDVRAYGETPKQAMDVHIVLDDALTGSMVNKDANDTRLYNAELEGGPLGLREPDTNFPFVQASYVIRYNLLDRN